MSSHIIVDKIAHYFNRKLSQKKHREILKTYKFIHVMNNGIHSVGILKFIQRHFNNNEHCFVFQVLRESTARELEGVKHVYNFCLKEIPWNSVQKVIFHGLFTKEYIDYLYRNPIYLKKSYWFIWGGDLYCNDDFKSRFVKQNFAGILTSFDQNVYRQKFGNNNCYDVTYPHDITEDLIEHVGERPVKPKIYRVLLNNSADQTTLEMLDILSKFKNEPIEIYTILSYTSANQKDCRLEIMKKGYTTFGDKFKPIIEFMPKKSYANFLNNIDIYISNQDRQQGNGNASFLCSLGKKIYTKSNTSVNIKYNSIGITYFDTLMIKDMSFSEFYAYDDRIREQTIKNIKKRMNENYKAKQWNIFFEDNTQ